MWRWGCAVFLLATALVTGTTCNHERSADASRLLALPPSERPAELKKYPLLEQVELFLTAMYAEHPRDLGLEEALASNGAPMVPVIVERLKSEAKDESQLYLIQVLGTMQQFGYCDVKSQGEVVRTVEDVISTMKPRFVSRAQVALAQIRGDRSNSK
jgi:hypothetical protein